MASQEAFFNRLDHYPPLSPGPQPSSSDAQRRAIRGVLCMPQQLGDLAPVRAVLALGGLELYGPHDVAFSLCEEQNYPVSRDPRPTSRGQRLQPGARGSRATRPGRRRRPAALSARRAHWTKADSRAGLTAPVVGVRYRRPPLASSPWLSVTRAQTEQKPKTAR